MTILYIILIAIFILISIYRVIDIINQIHNKWFN
jgi:hypothetical protein